MTRLLRTRIGLVAAIIVTGLAVGTGALVVSALTAAPEPAICDGVDRLFGGCDPDQPVFAGTTCVEVGSEFGRQLDERVVAILGQPDVVNGERKSVRISSAEFLLTARANQYLRDTGIIADCGGDVFLSAAEENFSDRLRSQVGAYLSEFQDHSYADWLADLRKTLRAIDVEKDAPYAPSAVQLRENSLL